MIATYDNLRVVHGGEAVHAKHNCQVQQLLCGFVNDIHYVIRILFPSQHLRTHSIFCPLKVPSIHQSLLPLFAPLPFPAS